MPEPKLIYQTPNAGHDLNGGKEAIQTLAAFYEMIADGKELPKMEWKIGDGANGEATVEVSVNQKVKAIRLWTANSSNRDFRDSQWSSRELDAEPSSSHTVAEIKTPNKSYRSYLAEVELTASDGHSYKLSTEARVTPDTIK